jgi:hypothetical protein
MWTSRQWAERGASVGCGAPSLKAPPGWVLVLAANGDLSLKGSTSKW